MAIKKTIKIFDLKEEINRLLLLDTLNDKQKEVLCNLIESQLVNTKNYHGYIYPELFTQKCSEWKKENPNLEFWNYIEINNLEYQRRYL